MIPDPSAAQPAVKMVKATLPPDLEKYYKMMKMNIPQHAVENKMRSDGEQDFFDPIMPLAFCRKTFSDALQKSHPHGPMF